MEVLSRDIASLRLQISSLHNLLPHLHSTILSLPSTHATLSRAPTNESSTKSVRVALAKQAAHNISTTYRLVAGITAFRVQDPDPYAVDSGRVLGLRIELPIGSRYGVPYFIFLLSVRVAGAQAEDNQTRVLKLHRHTLPVAVPIETLIRRYLALPDKKGKQARKQDLHAFARAVRNVVVGYHKRLAVVDKLRAEAGIDGLEDAPEQSDNHNHGNKKGKGSIAYVTSSDAAHIVEIGFHNGAIARLHMTRAGTLDKVAVRVVDEMDARSAKWMRSLKASIEGGDGRIEGVVARILEREQG